MSSNYLYNNLYRLTQSTGLTLPKAAEMAQDIEIKRVLKLEERYQEEIAELEQEIAIIDKQIVNKEGQRE